MRWADCAMMRFVMGVEHRRFDPRYVLENPPSPTFDLDCDGRTGSSDLPEFAAVLFHLPGDAIVSPFHTPEIMIRPELSSHYGTLLSSYLSLMVWTALIAR